MAKRKPKSTSKPKRGGKSKAGQRTSYGETTRTIIKLLARRGFTDVEIAQCLKITEKTFNNWKRKYPEFFQSLKDWKLQADEEIERSLYERGKGYSHPDTKAQWVESAELIDGEVVNIGRWEYASFIKHYPPDPTSMIFWLKNRKPKEWRDKIDHDLGKAGDALSALMEEIASRGAPKPKGDPDAV